MKMRAGIYALSALLLAWMATGCTTSSSAVTFYGLEAVAGDPSGSITLFQHDPSIGIGRVTLPAYLDRPQIVIRPQPNRLRVDEYHRWAGGLEDEIQRVLIENLMTLTGVQRIARLPWPGDFQPDVTLRMDIYRFEAGSGNTVRLLAAVTLVRRDDRHPPETWTIHLEEAPAGGTYADLTAAQSRLLAALSRDIAERLSRP